jgi:hypothetical protein
LLVSHFIQTEPSEDWTVEQVLQWHLLQSHAATDQKHDELVTSLKHQLEQGKKELWQLYEQSENKPNITTVSSFKKTETIHVKITTGPHAGTTVSLKPKLNESCVVGRSGSKKFKDKGVSLFHDSEVSTTHGKFEIISGKAYFTDVGSTNGTTCKTNQLQTNDPFLLEENLELILGASTLVITLS